MKRLTAQVMCHPLVAIAALLAADLLMRSDSGLSGAMYVVAAKSVSRLFKRCAEARPDARRIGRT